MRDSLNQGAETTHWLFLSILMAQRKAQQKKEKDQAPQRAATRRKVEENLQLRPHRSHSLDSISGTMSLRPCYASSLKFSNLDSKQE